MSMIYPANGSPFNSFTPLASEPPVALAQSLPFDCDANILLLGSGDARKILFSIFNDENESTYTTLIVLMGRIHAFV
jgi:hypothetical protein